MLPNYKPINVKLLYCYKCSTYTNHHKMANGGWVCWCGHVDDDPDEENAVEQAYRLEKSE